LALQEIIACLGFPVAGNPTQFVMERAFNAAGVDSRCLTVDVPPAELSRAVGGISAMGFRGAVIAEPHHESVCELVDRLAPPAEMLGATDLIYREDDKLVGDQAMVRSAMELLLRHAELQDRRAVVLGTSQIAAAATLGLALSGAAHVLLISRDDAQADRIARIVGEHTPCTVEVQPWVELLRLPAETRVVVQAGGQSEENTASTWQLDLAGLTGETLLLDTVYHPLRTEFLKQGEAAGCQTLHGLDLLVQWARVAFEIWTGSEPDVSVVQDAFEEFFLI